VNAIGRFLLNRRVAYSQAVHINRNIVARNVFK